MRWKFVYSVRPFSYQSNIFLYEINARKLPENVISANKQEELFQWRTTLANIVTNTATFQRCSIFAELSRSPFINELW